MSRTEEGTERTLEDVLVDVFDIIAAVRTKYLVVLKNVMASGNQMAIEKVQNDMNADVQNQLTVLGQIEGYQFPFRYSFESVIDFSLTYEVNGISLSSGDEKASEIEHQA